MIRINICIIAIYKHISLYGGQRGGVLLMLVLRQEGSLKYEKARPAW